LTRFSILIACWGVIISLYLSEGFLWLINPHRKLPINGWIDDEFYTWGHLVNVNRFGFREKDFEIPKPTNTKRIMVLGDSLTWGAGLAEEERYTNRLQKKLQSNLDTKNKTSIEVLNFALIGGPTIRERDIALKYFDIVKPDLILIGFCINDPQPKSMDWSIERENFIHSKTYYYLSIPLHIFKAMYLSNIASRFNDAIFNFAEIYNVIPNWKVGLDRVYDQSSIEWGNFLSALSDIKKLSDSNNLPTPIFAILNQAIESGMADDYRNIQEHRYLKWYKQVAEATEKIGYTTLDFQNEIKSLAPSTSLIINELDSHPSAILNQVYADKLYSLIKPILIN
jgi:hypothetical protein